MNETCGTLFPKALDEPGFGQVEKIFRKDEATRTQNALHFEIGLIKNQAQRFNLQIQ